MLIYNVFSSSAIVVATIPAEEWALTLEGCAEAILYKFWKEKGILSPRRILIESDVHLLDLPQFHVLENVNTLKAYRKILEKMERYSYRC